MHGMNGNSSHGCHSGSGTAFSAPEQHDEPPVDFTSSLHPNADHSKSPFDADATDSSVGRDPHDQDHDDGADEDTVRHSQSPPRTQRATPFASGDAAQGLVWCLAWCYRVC